MSRIEKCSKSLVIISGHEQDREVLHRMLAPFAQDFPTIADAADMVDGLPLLERLAPACCLLDYDLTRVDGANALAVLRERFPPERLSIVVVSRHRNEEPLLVALQSGAQDYVLLEDMTPPRLFGVLWNAGRSSALQLRLHHLAHYDTLTGLLNRSLLTNRLEQAVMRCDRYQQRCALLHVNIDKFKQINENYGLAVGDALLQAVAERIRAHCRNTDSPARIGSDEFLVLLEHVDSNTGHKVADKILKALDPPFDLGEHCIDVRADIGLVTYPDTAKSAAELIGQANQALRWAKEAQQPRFVSFSEQHKTQWRRQHRLELDLPKAINRGELSLVYQPIVGADTFELNRLEVLSRWPREDYAVQAFELIEMIDRLNLTEPFHEWLFSTAFEQLRKWRAEAFDPDLCVNIPANYCYNNVVSDCVSRALTRHQIHAHKVELEITESTLMRFPDRSIRVLQGLHDDGLRIAIDDFGTGYSSMSYLTRLPLDTLKIDRSFFLTEVQRERNRKVIEAITALGHSLDLKIIAEGVETERQLELARNVGCDLLQGYYFGKPQFPGEDWREYIGHFQHLILPKRA